ncbi:hypothetical protein HXX76_002067 [Chlamydomonas incerta]|uniref:Serine/threonine-protein phosphatase n=1 Tax=Chlamydomonas incerta TaxID=51695 RepID=A0A836B052_CHLIN|nr:hypothetical protein HXX76_002067 [Chlamydomonas incerta]|eukprot:KAG2443721.1 hypothetical protein HXX76_002067 [Chlamydomonas incerta]
MLLLFSLKIKWPDRIFLLRGNHEIDSINNVYGFRAELTSKWGMHLGTSLYNAFNESFAYMPLAGIAVPPGYEGEVPGITAEDSRQQSDSPRKQVQQLKYVPDRYLMMHGGIGRLEWLSEIAAAKRPLRGGDDEEHGNVLMEVVWSDPAPNDDDTGLQTSGRDGNVGGIVRYGADRVEEFCRRNHITAILRGHEVIQEGMEIAFGGRLLTFFSAANYGGRGTNDGVILNLALIKDQISGNTNIEVHPVRFEAIHYHGSPDNDDSASDVTEMEPHEAEDEPPAPLPDETWQREQLALEGQQPQPQPPSYADVMAHAATLAEVCRQVLAEGALLNPAHQELQQEGSAAHVLSTTSGEGQLQADASACAGCDPALSSMFLWSTAAGAEAAAHGLSPANAGSEGSAGEHTANGTGGGGSSPAAAEEDGNEQIVFCPKPATHSPGRRGLVGGGSSCGSAVPPDPASGAPDGCMQRPSGTSPVLTAEALCALNAMVPNGARLHELRNRWWLQNHGAGPQQAHAGVYDMQRVPPPPPGFEHVKLVRPAPRPPPGFGPLPRPEPGSTPHAAGQHGSMASAATASGDGASGGEDEGALASIAAGGFRAALAPAAAQQATARPLAVVRDNGEAGRATLALQSTGDMPDTSNLRRPFLYLAAAVAAEFADVQRAYDNLALAAQHAAARPLAAEPLASVRGNAEAGRAATAPLSLEADLVGKPPSYVALQSTCFDDEEPWEMPDLTNGPYVQRPYDDVVVAAAEPAAAADDAASSGSGGGNSGFGSPVNSAGFGSPVTSPTVARNGAQISARLDNEAASLVTAVQAQLFGAAAGSPPPTDSSPGARQVPSPLAALASSAPQTVFAVPSLSMLAPLLMQTAGAVFDAAADGDQAMADMDASQGDGEDDAVMRDAGGSGGMDVEPSAEAAGQGDEQQQAGHGSAPAAGAMVVEILVAGSPVTSPDHQGASSGAAGAVQPPSVPQLPPPEDQALSFPLLGIQSGTTTPFRLPVMVAPAGPQAGAAAPQPMPMITGSWSPTADAMAAAAMAGARSGRSSGGGFKFIPVAGAVTTGSPSSGGPAPGAQRVLSPGWAGYPARPASDPLPATARTRRVSMGSAGAAAAAAAAATAPRGNVGAMSVTGFPNRLALGTSEGSASIHAAIQHGHDPRRPTPPRMCRETGAVIENEPSQ